MFQRQTRSTFPARNLVILAAAVLAFLFFLLKSIQKDPTPAPEQQIDKEQSESKDSSLLPAEWFFTLREWPDFRTDVHTYTTALAAARQSDLVAKSRDGNYGFSTPWKLEGPANIGGRINCIAVHPSNPNIIYLGYSHGGVWKTEDGGQHWKPVFDDHDFLAIGHIAFDPAHPSVVYVGTGDPNISIYPFIGDGVWRSADGGETWEHLGLEDQRIVTKIIVHPMLAARIFVATMGLPFERNIDRGLYKSSNLGSSWQQKLFISNQAGIIDLVMSPTDPNTLYAAAWDRIRNNHESIVSGENARVWKSTDGGETWKKLGGGLPEDDRSRIGLAIDPSNANHLFASYVNVNLTFSGLFETYDGGETWKENPCQGLNFDFQSNFAWYFGQIRINPYNPSDVWLLGVQSWRSQDGGETWQLAAGFDQEVHADHHDIAFLGPQSYLLATDGGLYRSDDNAEVWQKIENIPTTQFYRVAYNPHQPQFYYGGAQDNGTNVGNEDFLENWIHVFGGDGFQAVFHPTDANIFYYEFQNGSIYGTTDGGTFEPATEGIDENDRRNWDMQYAISQHNEDVMYAGTYRIYQSFGHLPIWTPISQDLTDGIIFGARYHTISALNESPLDPDLLYVGTTDANVWRGRPANQDWVNITAGLPERYVSSVKASPTNPNRVFVSHTGYKDNDFTPRIHRSDDQGANWLAIVGDLPNLAVNDLIILPDHQDSIIFAATDGGVYGTINGGQHWERLGTGIPIVPVYSLGINPAQHTLVAGTFARSLLSFPLDSLKMEENTSAFTPNGSAVPMLSISPNPASIAAVLKVENLKSDQFTEVSIVDISGKTLFKKQIRGLGKHEEVIDLQDFALGVYVVYARTGGKVWGSKKFLVTR
ncbi:MAG: T9SS type A sorting domain-containing protein [Phycisphaerae bacterium]|nr:T9SS type A sorting domain-containing protein [Saprospiraceae bacterium]